MNHKAYPDSKSNSRSSSIKRVYHLVLPSSTQPSNDSQLIMNSSRAQFPPQLKKNDSLHSFSDKKEGQIKSSVIDLTSGPCKVKPITKLQLKTLLESQYESQIHEDNP